MVAEMCALHLEASVSVVMDTTAGKERETACNNSTADDCSSSDSASIESDGGELEGSDSDTTDTEDSQSETSASSCSESSDTTDAEAIEPNNRASQHTNSATSIPLRLAAEPIPCHTGSGRTKILTGVCFARPMRPSSAGARRVARKLWMAEEAKARARIGMVV